MGSFRVQESEGIGYPTIIEDMLSEFVIFDHRGVSGMYFKLHYHICVHTSWESSKQDFHLRVLSQGSLVDHNAADVVVGEDKTFQADVPMFLLVFT